MSDSEGDEPASSFQKGLQNLKERDEAIRKLLTNILTILLEEEDEKMDEQKTSTKKISTYLLFL